MSPLPQRPDVGRPSPRQVAGSPPPPDPRVVRRIVVLVLIGVPIAVGLVLRGPAVDASSVPRGEDYALVVDAVELTIEEPQAVGERVPVPTRHVAVVEDVEVLPPRVATRVPWSEVIVELSVREVERTNLRPRWPQVSVRLEDGRRYRGRPCEPADADQAEADTWVGRTCVRIPPAAREMAWLVELEADLAAGPEVARWQVDPSTG